jgi:hypothetical protein
MKLSIASLSGSDYGLRPQSVAQTVSRPASSSLFDDDDDVPTTLHRPRRIVAGRPDPKARPRTKLTATHAL